MEDHFVKDDDQDKAYENLVEMTHSVHSRSRSQSRSLIQEKGLTRNQITPGATPTPTPGNPSVE